MNAIKSLVNARATLTVAPILKILPMIIIGAIGVQTISCSSDDGGGGATEYSFCVFSDNETCLEGPFTACQQNGMLSNSCPFASAPSSSSVEPSSSSSGGTDGSSSSGGGSSSSEGASSPSSSSVSSITQPTAAGFYMETATGYVSIDLAETSGTTVVDKALAYVNANAAEGAYLLIIGEDIELEPSVNRRPRQDNARLAIKGDNAMRTISLSTTAQGYMFGVGARVVSKAEPIGKTGISLTIGNNITLKGREGNDRSVVYVEDGAAFIMQDNSVITGNEDESGVDVSTGTFTMKGNATITKNTDGGVRVSGDGSIFTMQDNAKITDNEASQSGGGVYVEESGCIFIMKDNASITGNKAAGDGGGVYAYGTFTMENGTISGNETSGMGNGGGVYVSSGTFTMENGTISGNEISGMGYGGGVYVSVGEFTMKGGAISGNKAMGGNVYGGYGRGGGVYVRGSSYGGDAIFAMEGGIISGNEASKNGGGVYVDGGGNTFNSIFKISNGMVYGNSNSNGNNSNTSADEGAALYVGASYISTDTYIHGIAQYGNGESWTDIPVTSGGDNIYGLYNYRDATINVVNGVLQ